MRSSENPVEQGRRSGRRGPGAVRPRLVGPVSGCIELALAAGFAAGVPARALAPEDVPVVRAAASAVYTRATIDGTPVLALSEVRRTLDLPFPADSLESRLGRLARRYYDLGYVDARFHAETTAEGVLELRLDPGNPARLARLYLRGAEQVPETLARELLDLRPGQVFRSAEVEMRLQALVDEYADRGYLDAEATLERLEFAPEGVVLGIAISEGGRATLVEVTVGGNATTRVELVQRLAGLRPPQPANAGRIRDAPQLLRRSGLFAAVGSPLLYRTGAGEGRVGVLLQIVEVERRNSVFGALGMARDPARDRPYLTGSIDLGLRNIYGTGRDLGLAWRRDARLGSRLAVSYRERFLVGTPLDLGLDLSQTVRDSTSTWQTLGATGSLPLGRNLGLDLRAAYDRSVYHLGPRGNTQRLRVGGGLGFASLLGEADGARFGTLEVHGEYARRRNHLAARSEVRDDSRVDERIWGGRFEAGIPLAPRHVLAARGEWHVLDGAPAPVPQSELFEFGGAQTLRGYREGQFRGDQVAYGGIEYRYGNPRGPRVYGFLDAGAYRRHLGEGKEEAAHVGYGLGLRAAIATGTLDLAFGVGDERSLGAVKLHASLVQTF